MSREHKIRALRALAASTTFPAERESALAKAVALEAIEGPSDEARLSSWSSMWASPSFEQAMRSHMNSWLEVEAIGAAEKALDAVRWNHSEWAIPGIPALVSKDELMRLYVERAAA